MGLLRGDRRRGSIVAAARRPATAAPDTHGAENRYVRVMADDLAPGVSFVQLDLAGEERFQTLRRELGVSTFGLNLIRLAPGNRGRIHTHERQEEVFLVLEGTLSLAVEGEEHDVPALTAARVAPQVRRQLINRGPGRVALLALGGAEAHNGRDGVVYTDWTSPPAGVPQDVPMPDDLPASELRT
jgi:uncharacterized cupin superfamily protein